MSKILIAVVLITLVTLFIMTKIDPHVSNNETNISTSIDDDYFTTKIEGEILRPGSYIMEDGATMDDLLMAAGGATNNADARAYFTTTELVKGQSYYIPPLYDDGDICNSYPLEKANINEDDSASLQTVNGIGATIANAIVSYRENHGNYSFLEEIMNVSGIGQATYTKVRDYLVLQ